MVSFAAVKELDQEVTVLVEIFCAAANNNSLGNRVVEVVPADIGVDVLADDAVWSNFGVPMKP